MSTRLSRTRSRLPRLPPRRYNARTYPCPTSRLAAVSSCFGLPLFADALCKAKTHSFLCNKEDSVPYRTKTWLSRSCNATSPNAAMESHVEQLTTATSDSTINAPRFPQEELRKHAMASPAPKSLNSVALGRGETPRSTRKQVTNGRLTVAIEVKVCVESLCDISRSSVHAHATLHLNPLWPFESLWQ